MDQSLYRQLVWDYNLSQSDFEKILKGQKSLGQLNQAWAIARVLEHTNYYQAIKLVPLPLLKKVWAQIKPKIFSTSIKQGYEYILQRYTLSTPR